PAARLPLRSLRRLPEGAGLFHAAGRRGPLEDAGQPRRGAAAARGGEGGPGAAGIREPRRRQQAGGQYPEAGRGERRGAGGSERRGIEGTRGKSAARGDPERFGEGESAL